nr:vegetative cell wall protein gp1-like [Aegilops tauschii subsp. strangulata]
MHRPRPRHCAHLAADLAPPLLRPATAPPLRPAPQRPTRRPPCRARRRPWPLHRAPPLSRCGYPRRRCCGWPPRSTAPHAARPRSAALLLCRARCSASVATALLHLLAPPGSPPPCWPSFARPALRHLAASAAPTAASRGPAPAPLRPASPAPALLAPAIWANAQSGAATPDPPR